MADRLISENELLLMLTERVEELHKTIDRLEASPSSSSVKERLIMNNAKCDAVCQILGSLRQLQTKG